jgi:transcriptional regulator with XRE-family HTH domain
LYKTSRNNGICAKYLKYGGLLRENNDFRGDILSIAERLKKARESMQLSQSEFAKIAGASFPSWQGYESGKNAPGSKVLEKLAEFGFNGHWLLTGKGGLGLSEDYRTGGSKSLGRKVKQLRGERTIEEFSKQMEVAEEDLENIEAGVTDCTSSFLSALSYHFDLNPLFFWRTGVEIKDFQLAIVEKAATVNIELLKEVTTVIEEALFKAAIMLEPARKAELFALVYDYAAESEENRAGIEEHVKRLLRLIRI